MKKLSSHTKALEKIALNPQAFGISSVRGVQREVELKYGSDREAEPDIVFHCEKGILCIVEYKGRRHKGSEDKANIQLQKAVEWYVKCTPYKRENIRTIIITGDDETFKNL